MTRILLLAATALALTAGAASAQSIASQALTTKPLAGITLDKVGAQDRAPIDLSSPASRLPVHYAQSGTPLPPGIARTSVEHSFSAADEEAALTAAAGVLCGLQPGDNTGAAAAYGYDPQGKFVGAKLSLAF